MAVKIGWGRREISIDEPMSLPGQVHMRISEGILDPMYMTALCVDGGEGQDQVVFLSCDMLSPASLGEIGELVAKKHPEFPVRCILANGTHAHTGGAKVKTPEKSPDGKDIYPGEKYQQFLLQMGAEAVCEAWENRADGAIAYGYGYAVVGHSRRVIYFDDTSLRQKANPVAPNGHGVMYGNTKDDQFSHYEAGADHFLNAMFTFDAKEKLTGMIVNVPCPSQTSEMFTVQTADYWNEVREGVKKEFGEDVYVLPQCAAAGDLSPRILHYKQAQARRMKLKYGLEYDGAGLMNQKNKAMAERYDIAERILLGLQDIYSWAKKDIQSQPAVRHAVQDMKLARRLVTDEEKKWCEENIEKMRTAIPNPDDVTPEEYRFAMSRYNTIKNRNQRAIDSYETQKENPWLETAVHAVQIGDIAFASNRFELYQDYMHRIQARSPFIQTFVVQLAGFDGGSYLPTQRGVENKGYSASLFCNVVGPEGGQQLVEGTLEMLQELKDR